MSLGQSGTIRAVPLDLWMLHERPRATSRAEASLAPVTVLLILLTPFVGQPVLLTGLLLTGLLAIKLVGRHRAVARPAPENPQSHIERREECA
jgi:hypothetical protein